MSLDELLQWLYHFEGVTFQTIAWAHEYLAEKMAQRRGYPDNLEGREENLANLKKLESQKPILNPQYTSKSAFNRRNLPAVLKQERLRYPSTFLKRTFRI